MEGEGERVKEGKRERGRGGILAERKEGWEEEDKQTQMLVCTDGAVCPLVQPRHRSQNQTRWRLGRGAGWAALRLKCSMKAANPGVKEKHLFLLLPRWRLSVPSIASISPFWLESMEKILEDSSKFRREIRQKSILKRCLIRSSARSFCMRSTPITRVLLSFPHNRSLSLYSPLLNWSILHLNQDISTTGRERGKNEYERASRVDGTADASRFSTFGQNIRGKRQKREIFAVVLVWVELASLRVINTHLNPEWGERSQ